MAAIICSGVAVVTACGPRNYNSLPTVQSTELIRTSQSWDGVELPDYLKGRPELVAVKYEFPAGQKLGWHHHPVMNYGTDHHRPGREREDRARRRGCRGDVKHHSTWGEQGLEDRHPVHVLSLTGWPSPGRAAPGDSAEIAVKVSIN